MANEEKIPEKYLRYMSEDSCSICGYDFNYGEMAIVVEAIDITPGTTPKKFKVNCHTYCLNKEVFH